MDQGNAQPRFVHRGGARGGGGVRADRRRAHGPHGCAGAKRASSLRYGARTWGRAGAGARSSTRTDATSDYPGTRTGTDSRPDAAAKLGCRPSRSDH